MATSTAYDQQAATGHPDADELPHVRRRGQGEPRSTEAWFKGADGLQWIGMGIMVGALSLSAAVICNGIFQGGRWSGGRRNDY